MPEPLHIVAASALVIDGAGHVLLVRSPKRGWELPGGKIDPGETLIAGVMREVREEAGVSVEVGALTGVYSNVHRRSKVIFNFVAMYVSGALTPSAETPEVGWFPYAQVLEQITHHGMRRRAADALAFSGTPLYVAYSLKPYTEYAVHEL